MRKGLFILFVCLLVSCSKDEIGPQYPTVSGEPSGSVYLVGEGNFGWGNASVALYDPGNQSVAQGVYQSVNGQPLGDIAQSMFSVDGFFFISVNNSGKLEVVDTGTFASAGTISGLNSPRYMSSFGNKLFVTDLYADAVSIVDLSSMQIAGSIPVPGWTEHITTWQGKVFVSLPSDSILLQIDPVSETVNDTLFLRPGPGRILADMNDKLWVLCRGNSNRAGALFRIDPVTHAIEEELSFPAGDNPGMLNISSYGDTLFYVNDDCYKMPVVSTILPVSPFVNLQGIDPYSMAVDPANNEVYISDALNFTQQSTIYRFSSAGQPIDQFNGPINCGEIVFH